jgi:hypothetical protein
MDDLRYRKCKLLKDLLSNPLMNEAMAEAHLDIINRILASDPIDKEGREALYNESRAFTRITGRLTSLANEAIMEEDKVQKAKLVYPGAN